MQYSSCCSGVPIMKFYTNVYCSEGIGEEPQVPFSRICNKTRKKGRKLVVWCSVVLWAK